MGRLKVRLQIAAEFPPRVSVHTPHTHTHTEEEGRRENTAYTSRSPAVCTNPGILPSVFLPSFSHARREFYSLLVNRGAHVTASPPSQGDSSSVDIYRIHRVTVLLFLFRKCCSIISTLHVQNFKLYFYQLIMTHLSGVICDVSGHLHITDQSTHDT